MNIQTRGPIDERTRHLVSTAELERRWAAVRAAMVEHGIDCLVMQNNNDFVGGYVRWFTDVAGQNGYPRAVLFPRDGLMTVFEQGADATERGRPEDPLHRGVEKFVRSWGFSSAGYTKYYDARNTVAELKRAGFGTVGLVGTAGMQFDYVDYVRDNCGARIVDATDLVDDIKAIKSAEEQTQIRACADMHDRIFTELAASIRPGMRDFEVSAKAWDIARRTGGEQGIVIGQSAPLGMVSGFALNHLQGRELRDGDHLSFLVELNGPGGQYCELARTFVFGKPTPELSDAFSVMREAQALTVSLMRPGADCGDVFRKHNAFMRSHGLPEENRLHAHGQGYDMVERPLVRPDEPMPIKAGMNFAVHPGYRNERVFGIVCDNFFITETGNERVHRTPQALIEIG